MRMETCAISWKKNMNVQNMDKNYHYNSTDNYTKGADSTF